MNSFSLISTDRDFDKLANLAEEIWHEHYSDILSFEQIAYMLESFQSKSAFRKQTGDGYEYYFINDNSKNAGYIGLQKCPGYLFLSKLYIKKDHRGKGLGKKAIEFVLQRAKELGCDKVVLTVNKENVNSISVYEKLGFKKTDSIVTDIGAGFVMNDYIYTYFMSSV